MSVHIRYFAFAKKITKKFKSLLQFFMQQLTLKVKMLLPLALKIEASKIYQLLKESIM